MATMATIEVHGWQAINGHAFVRDTKDESDGDKRRDWCDFSHLLEQVKEEDEDDKYLKVTAHLLLQPALVSLRLLVCTVRMYLNCASILIALFSKQLRMGSFFACCLVNRC